MYYYIICLEKYKEKSWKVLKSRIVDVGVEKICNFEMKLNEMRLRHLPKAGFRIITGISALLLL